MATLYELLIYTISFVISLTPQTSYSEGLVGQPQSFLPHEVATETDKSVSKLLFRGLFAYDKEGNLTNDLVDSYDISKDELEYTIYIKKNQRWSNGQEITSDDLLYSAFTNPQLREIATDKIDRYTIRYVLPNKYSPFLDLLTVGVIPAIPSNDKLQPISSGPYKITRIKHQGPVVKELILEEINRTYNISQVKFRYYENEDRLETAFKLGEVDGFVSSKDFSYPSVNKKQYFARGVYQTLYFNIRNDKLKNINVRKKLVSVTPLELLAKDKGHISSGPISQNYFTDELINYKTYDSNLSGDLNLQLVLTVPNTPQHIETAELLRDIWKKLNVSLAIKPVEAEKIEQDIVRTRDFEVLLFGQEVSRDPDRYVLWHSTKIYDPGYNLSGLSNIRLDRSLEEGRNTINILERKKHYKVFQEVMHENAPAIFLYHPYVNFYYSRKLELTELPSFYYASDRFLDIKNWKKI